MASREPVRVSPPPATAGPAAGRRRGPTAPAGRIIAGHTVRALPLLVAFVLLGAAITLAVAAGSPWWLIAVGIIGPDLSFLAGIGATPTAPGLMPARVVPVYNAVHHPVGPALLLAVATVLASAPLGVLGLAWASHLAWDRGVGYTLRRRDGSLR